MVISGFCEEAD